MGPGVRPLAGVSVLVVEDNEDAREILRLMLDYAGALVEVAAGAKEALARLQVFLPDVIVSDLNMPGVDGEGLLRQLQASSIYRDVPVIALTAVKERETERRALAAGFRAYLVKPIDAAQLIDCILCEVYRRKT